MKLLIPFFLVIAEAAAAAATSSSSSSSSSSKSLRSSTGKDTIFTQADHETFQRDGYVVVRGLLEPELVKDLVQAAKHTVDVTPKIPFYYSVSIQGAMFGTGSNCTRLEEQQQQNGNKVVCEEDPATKAFRQASLHSKLPQAVAELMQLDPETQNLRVLRDVFLAKAVNASLTCDWHVDDTGFWPESYISPASPKTGKDQHGLNVWVALTDMPAAYQGSMAVAPGSHTAEWRWEAYHALGQNRTTDGGLSKEEVIRKVQENQKKSANTYPTCDMPRVNPELRAFIEGQRKVIDIRQGDVVFATRMLFHRTLEVPKEGIEYYNSIGQEFLNRYSIRYVPGTAKLPNGWSVEWSVLSDPKNTGRSLNDISTSAANGANFYPQVWPVVQDDWQQGMDAVAARIPDMKAKAHAEFMETIFGGVNKPAATPLGGSSTNTATEK